MEVDIKQTKIDGIVRELQKKSNELSVVLQKGEEFVSALKGLEAEIKKLRNAQKRGTGPKIPDRRNFDWKPFLKWLKDNGFPTDDLEIAYFPDRGHGLLAKRDIKAGEKVVNVPLKLMMTNETAVKSKLALLLHNDQMLQNIYSLSLALHLLLEQRTMDSFWGPYINTLPKQVPNSPLYWSIEEILQLKSTYAIEELAKFKVLCTKAYTHVYFRLEKQMEMAIMKRANFTYDAFLWAFATVHSRQNRIVLEGKNKQPITALALVPVYDLINHEAGGNVTTNYNLENHELESCAVRDFKKGEEIRMFYGDRCNVELFVYSGFVVPDNVHNWATLSIEFPPNDPLKEKKVEILTQHNIPENPTFALFAKQDNNELLSFLRIVGISTEEELTENAEKAFVEPISSPNELIAYTLLESRLQQRLKSYPTSIEADRKALKAMGGQTTPEAFALQLQIDEKYIFKEVIKRITTKKKTLLEDKKE
jgi:histone-lysine N-methyltransferase SETD3